MRIVGQPQIINAFEKLRYQRGGESREVISWASLTVWNLICANGGHSQSEGVRREIAGRKTGFLPRVITSLRADRAAKNSPHRLGSTDLVDLIRNFLFFFFLFLFCRVFEPGSIVRSRGTLIINDQRTVKDVKDRRRGEKRERK